MYVQAVHPVDPHPTTPLIQLNDTPHSPQGNTPFHHAALAEGSDVAAFLLQQTGGALPVAAGAGAPIPLVHLCNTDGETPLLLAAGAGHLPTLKFLLEQGSDLAAADAANGQTAFHHAARSGRVWALHFLHAAAVRRWGPQGAHALLQQPDAEGHTCLDWAAVMGHLPCLKLLLRRGLDPRRPDAKGRCSLHLAARAGRAEVCRYLIARRGLDPTALRDAEGKDARAHARPGDCAVRAALRVAVASSEAGGSAKDDGVDTPTRLQPVRPGFLAAIALASAALWLLPFLLPWYGALPLAAFASSFLAWARRQQQQKQQGGATTSSSSSSSSSMLAHWARGPEAYPGFWLGTMAAFVASEPLLHYWPRSVAWLSGDELVAAAVGSKTGGSAAGLIATYAAFAATSLLWADLVLWRPDPGTAPFDGAALEQALAEVVATASPPPPSLVCHTCLVRKPPRSKVFK